MRKKYHINSSFMLALCVILTQTKDFQRNPTFLGLSGKKWHSNFLCDIFFKPSLSFVKTKKKVDPIERKKKEMEEEREEERRFDKNTTLNKIWRDIGQILWEGEKENDFGDEIYETQNR